MINRFSCVILLCLLNYTWPILSQNKLNLKHEALAEKIYLQLDSNIYTTDKTIWFKAILANAVSHNLEITSGVLYVDLINSNNKIVESKLLKIKNGIGKGFFDLNRSYKDGSYQIRAYTEWNKNFDDDFITKKDIKIFSEKPKIIDNILANDKPTDNIEDSTKIGRELDLSLRFFPEGGKIIKDLPVKIGFKATDNNGKGIVVKGEIVNKDNEIICTFKSNEVGLGHFEVGKNLTKTLNKARILNENENTYRYYDLPEIHEFGYTLSIIERKKSIIVAVNSNLGANDGVVLRGSVRGKDYFTKEVSLIDNRYIFTIPKFTFPNGVIIFQLANKNNEPISERLYFNELSERYLDINAKLSSIDLEKRETVSIDLGFENEQNLNEEASASVLVLDKSLYADIESNRDNLLSFLLLSSDVKGRIEKPGRYFSNEDRLNVDDLMLTQGWRNYKYVTQKKKLNFKLEKGLRIKGVVNVKNSNSKQESLDVIMTTLGDDYSIYSGTVSVPGSFDFQIDDLYGGEKKMIFKPNGLEDKMSKNYNITLIKQKKIQPNFIPYVSDNIIIQDTFNHDIVEINRIQLKKLNKYYTNITGVTELEEVIIDAYKMTPKRKEMFERYGAPNLVIEGEELLEKNPKWSSGLFDVIASGFRDKLFVTREIGSTSLSVKSGRSSKGYITLWVIDGIPVYKDQYNLLELIRPEEVTSLEVIENAKKLKDLISIVNGEPPPFGLIDGAVISIYTKSGRGLYGAIEINKGVKVHTIPVFSGEKEFYIPNHGDGFSNGNFEPDLRSTIYWKPDFKLNSQKPNNLKFSHSDNTGEFLVIIEAITEDGRVGYKTLNYKVLEPED